MNYYNEIDKGAAQWLRNLICAGLIPPGDVDQRSITEVQPDDLRGYTQCHFFAGIGGWPHALQLAGWPSTRPVWTGSCPCQPFSIAGKGLGEADERHLWPEFYRLIAECCPATVFGEQVASKDGRAWLSGVRADLEGVGYAVGAADLCAAGVGAPHIRQRLYWMASGRSEGLAQRESDRRIQCEALGAQPRQATERGGVSNRVSDADGHTLRKQSVVEFWRGSSAESSGSGETHWLGLSNSDGCKPGGGATAPLGHWSSFITTSCADGKARRIPAEPAFHPLAHGIPARVVRLRGYGNAIVPQVAAQFISAAMEIAA